MMPSVVGIPLERPLWDVQTQLNHPQQLVATPGEVFCVCCHVGLQVLVRPRARPMTRPLPNDSVVIFRQVLGHGKYFRIVGHTIRHLLPRGNVPSVAILVHAPLLLYARPLKEAPAGCVGILIDVLLLRRHGDLEDAVPPPSLNHGPCQRPVIGRPRDLAGQTKCVQTAKGGGISRRHGAATTDGVMLRAQQEPRRGLADPSATTESSCSCQE